MLKFKLYFGFIIIFLVFVAGVFSKSVAPYDPSYRDSLNILSSPSHEHLLGTDEEGRDVLTLVIFGAKTALFIGIGTVIICVFIGTFLGIISGLKGGITDVLIQRIIEIMQSFPGILLAILIIFVTGKPNELAILFALSVTGWTQYARIVRGQVLSLKNNEFIVQARLFNVPTRRIVFLHILPNIIGEVSVLMTFHVATTILAEAGLSFLGLGPQSGLSWGALLEQGAVLFIKSPLIGVVGGGAIAITVLGINFLGDYLRDVVDPNLKV